MRPLRLEILAQPDDVTCGPTCLQAVYAYHGLPEPLGRVIEEVEPLAAGGTLAVSLANHALLRGWRALIYTYNLHVFDPTWFERPGIDLRGKLEAQARRKRDRRLREASTAYLRFLSQGGTLRMEELRPRLIRRWLERDRPILTGLSATYLYGCAREVGERVMHFDDVGGAPQGHFVVLCGFDRDRGEVLVADPLHDNPGFRVPSYWVGIERLVGAILLGVLTYDANLLVLEPPEPPA